MRTLIVQTDSIINANFLASFLRNHRMVRSVSIEPDTNSQNVVSDPAAEYNWASPSRPATDEEIERMLDECETQYAAGKGIPLEKARALTKKRITEWKKKNRR